MKKLLLFLALPLMFIFALPAQITQEKADEIAIERMGSETGFTLYAKEGVQTEGFTVATATGEILELDYPCWVYFAKYTGKTNHKYLIVKESNGNLLEVNTKNDEVPDDLTNWREVTKEVGIDIPPILIAQGQLSGGEEIPQQNLVIKMQEDWNNLLNTMNSVNNESNSFIETSIDFSNHQVIAVFDKIRPHIPCNIRIMNITEYKDCIVVVVSSWISDEGYTLIAQPYYIVKIPVVDKEIIFKN